MCHASDGRSDDAVDVAVDGTIDEAVDAATGRLSLVTGAVSIPV
jgi:hypothetical protein